MAGVLVCLVLALCSQKVAAQSALPLSAPCTNMPAYAALANDQAGTFDVYVRLARAGERGDVKVYAQGNGPSCTQLGSLYATGDGWQHVAVWPAPGAGHLTQFVLESSVFQGLLEANRPMLMLVPRTSPICQPTDECRVTVQGQQGVIRPSTRSTQGDTLRLVEVRDPQQDQLKDVNYYIDNQPTYSKPQLEPFDLHYVGPGEHTLQRVLQYSSGQQVVMSETVNRGYGAKLLEYMFLSFIYGRKTVLRLAVGIILVVLSWWLILLLIHALYRRHLWKVGHIVKRPFLPGDGQATPLPEPLHLTKPDPPFIAFLKYMLPAGLIIGAAAVLVMGLDRYVVQIYQIEGSSMRNTLQPGDTALISRWDLTWADLTNKPYLPSRGDVVVVERSAGVLSQDPALIKRVIGLPGDRVTIVGDTITVFNASHPEGFNPDADGAWRHSMLPGEGDTLPGLRQTIDITVGLGQVFICGDNRGQSTDSRTFGTVDAEALSGQAVLRLNPFSIL